jgi:hypothetical protein
MLTVCTFSGSNIEFEQILLIISPIFGYIAEICSECDGNLVQNVLVMLRLRRMQWLDYTWYPEGLGDYF